MKCQLCTKPYTYNMNCRACTVRWLKTLPDWYKRQWLKDYRGKHGTEKMQEIISEILGSTGTNEQSQ